MKNALFQTHAVKALAGRTLRWYFDSPAAAVTLFVFYLITGYLFSAPLFLVKTASLRGLADLAPLLLSFLVPALTMGLLSEELRSGTFETLATMPLEDWDIVLGKYLGFAGLHLACVAGLLFYLPILGLCVSPAVGLDWGEALGTLLGLLLTGWAFGAAGLFASSLGRSGIVSFVAGFLACFVLFLLGKTAGLLPGAPGALAGYIGVDSHLDNLAKGVLDSRDLFYFASLIAGFLYLAVGRLQSRRTSVDPRHRRRALAFSWAGSAAVLAVLAAANALSAQVFARLDLSANRVYSVSRGTRDLLRGLQDTLTVRVYYTRGLPAPYGPGRRYLQDLLAEYRRLGRGRVQVEMLDPSGEKRRREALESGVAPLQLSVASRERFEVKESFMGAVFLYRGRSEVIPVFGGLADLEYDITRRIKKLAAPRTGTVGFVSGHGEAEPGDPASGGIFAMVSEEMTAVPVSLEKPVPPEVETLWAWGPKSAFKPAELERLKAWLASGRTLGLLLSRRAVDMRSLRARPLETGLEKLLGGWGLELADGFVVDAQCEKIQMEVPYGPLRSLMVLDYPFIPVATRLERRHPALRGLDAVSFPFVSPVRAQAAPALKYTSLADSSPASWLRPGPPADPTVPVEELATKDAGPFSLAGVLEGDFSAGASSAPAPGRLVLVGTGDMAGAQFADKASVSAFLMNLLEWSLQDETLLSIRSKAAAYRPLRPMPLAAVLAAKAALIFLPPLVLAAAAAARWLRRRSRRRELAEGFDAA